MSRQIFFSIFSKNVVFSEKLLNEKIFQTSFPIKKSCIHSRCQTPPFLYKRLGPQKRFSVVFSENYTFWKKLVNNKIFDTSFVIKKLC